MGLSSDHTEPRAVKRNEAAGSNERRRDETARVKAGEGWGVRCGHGCESVTEMMGAVSARAPYIYKATIDRKSWNGLLPTHHQHKRYATNLFLGRLSIGAG